MKVRISERGVKVSELLRAHVAKRLGLALGRFGTRVGQVVVHFSATAEGKRCQIDVGLRPRRLRVEDSDADLFAALDSAAVRVSRSVAHALERETD